jgi:hypothetical protein
MCSSLRSLVGFLDDLIRSSQLQHSGYDFPEVLDTAALVTDVI